MAQFETTGGGYIDSGDKRIDRRVVIATGGGNIQAPGGQGVLTNVSITDEPGGIKRGVFEYTQAGAGDANYNQYGKRIELTGGTREVPILTHERFKNLTEEQIATVQTAVENKTAVGITDETMAKLYSFLRRGVEYVLAPSVVARISEIQSALPSLDPVAKVANPNEITAPSNTFWICTAITASPIGTQYEVTTEYTLSFSSWDDVADLYNW